MFENIDWELLRQQKHCLLQMTDNPELSQYEYDTLQGIITLIDAVQDHAVDVLGIDENIVFNLTED